MDLQDSIIKKQQQKQQEQHQKILQQIQQQLAQLQLQVEQAKLELEQQRLQLEQQKMMIELEMSKQQANQKLIHAEQSHRQKLTQKQESVNNASDEGGVR